MGGSDSEERKGNKEEDMLSPKAHADKEKETAEARARVDQLWRTILSTGNNSSEGEGARPMLEMIDADRISFRTNLRYAVNVYSRCEGTVARWWKAYTH